LNGIPSHQLFPLIPPYENQQTFTCTQLLVIGNEFQNMQWRARYQQYRIPVHVFREIDDEFLSGHPLRRQFNIIYNLIQQQDRQDRIEGREINYYYMREVNPRLRRTREVQQMLREPEQSDEVTCNKTF